MNIDVRQLRHLLAAARHPSLRAAAEALHLTQPALSKSIARFEHELGAALFKRDGRYHMITSGCTGWTPNAAQHAVADSIWGPWEVTGNPCVGEGRDRTFESQSTYVLPVEGKDDAFIFMADRWVPEDPIDGRYVWLPIEFEDDRPTLRWRDTWRPAASGHR